MKSKEDIIKEVDTILEEVNMSTLADWKSSQDTDSQVIKRINFLKK